MVDISSQGDIADGRRVGRHEGMTSAANYYINSGFIIQQNGWMRWRPRKKLPENNWRATESMAGSGADRKIGWYRFEQFLIPAIQKHGKAFRPSWFWRWVEQLSAAEFGVSAQTPLGPFVFGLVPLTNVAHAPNG